MGTVFHTISDDYARESERILKDSTKVEIIKRVCKKYNVPLEGDINPFDFQIAERKINAESELSFIFWGINKNEFKQPSNYRYHKILSLAITSLQRNIDMETIQKAYRSIGDGLLGNLDQASAEPNTDDTSNEDEDDPTAQILQAMQLLRVAGALMRAANQ